jgi:pimeloyl-ACP methyl ester carboxylesterase
MTTDQASAGLAVAELPQGRISYRAAGPRSSSRPPVVFAHGLLTDSRLWEPVAGRLAAEGIRSYAPTLPLGSHRQPMNADADLTPAGVAGLLGNFIAALDLRDVTIVGNDTGGAICQLVLAGQVGAAAQAGPAGRAGQEGRIGAAVLTNCDAFDAFPPRALAPLFFAGRHPALVAGLLPGLRSDRIRTGRLGFGPLTSAPLDAGLTRSWIEPLADRAIRRDLARFARGVHPQVLLSAAERFGRFTGPVRVLWGDDDAYFGVDLGRRLSEAFPRTTLTTVPGGRTFLPLEHPDAVAAEIVAAVRDAVPHQG